MSEEPSRNRIVRKKRGGGGGGGGSSVTKDNDGDSSSIAAEKAPLLPDTTDNDNKNDSNNVNDKDGNASVDNTPPSNSSTDNVPPMKPQRSPRLSPRPSNDNDNDNDNDNTKDNNNDDSKDNDDTNGNKNRSRFRRARTDRPPSNDPSEAAALIANNAGNNWRDDKIVKPGTSTTTRGFISSYFNTTLCCKLGYEMKVEKRVIISNNRSELNELVRERTEGYCVGLRSLAVSSTGPSLPGMVKPSVKVHVVNRETGVYIHNYRKVAVKPVYTYSCIPQDQTDLPSWNQELILDASYLDIIDDDTLMLFELLDERPSLKMNSNNARKSLSKRIAWGYLVPVGSKGQVHIGMKEGWKKDDKINDKIDRRIERRRRKNDDDDGKDDSKNETTVTIQDAPKTIDKSLRIQLYAVREDDGIIGYMQRRIMNWPSYSSSYNTAYPNGIPEVYIQWRRQNKVMLHDAALKFSIGPRNIETVVDFGGLPLVEATSADEVGQGSTHGGAIATILDVQNKGDTSKLRAAVMRRSRSHREPCVIPDKLLHRFDSGPEGAMVVAYSHSGHLLAVSGRSATLNAPLSDHNSSVSSNSVYCLKLFDTDLGTEVWCLNSAHHGVVYDIRWSKDDSYIVTCSGDGTSKIWDVECYMKMSFTAIHHGTPGKGIDGAMSPAIRHQPYLAHVLRTVPPLYVYCAIFQEYNVPTTTIDMTADVKDSYEKQRSELPRVITGSSDGRLRVWAGSKLLGTLCIGDDDDAPHDNRINSIVIDERTRYLISGDGDGEILMWRQDPKGWYQLLRKFRKDASLAPLKSVNLGALDKKHVVSGVMSMYMHPDRNKAQMTVLTSKPTSLRVYNMTTYKTLSQCHGIISHNEQTSGLCRAQISADGNYVVCGSSVNTSEDKFCLRVWETLSGNVESCNLSDIVFPYPVRSVSWHPKQHVIAVGMVGPGAAVAIYAAHREVAERAVARINALAAATIINNDDKEDIPSSNTSIASFNTQSTTQGKQITSSKVPPPKTPLAPIKENIKGMLNSKTKEILDKISQAKSEIQ